jgi:hypothetical protein
MVRRHPSTHAPSDRHLCIVHSHNCSRSPSAATALTASTTSRLLPGLLAADRGAETRTVLPAKLHWLLLGGAHRMLPRPALLLPQLACCVASMLVLAAGCWLLAARSAGLHACSIGLQLRQLNRRSTDERGQRHRALRTVARRVRAYSLCWNRERTQSMHWWLVNRSL